MAQRCDDANVGTAPKEHFDSWPGMMATSRPRGPGDRRVANRPAIAAHGAARPVARRARSRTWRRYSPAPPPGCAVSCLAAGGGGPKRPGNRPSITRSGGRGVILLVLLAVIVWLGTGFYRVQPDEQGVVLRFGAFDRTSLPGLNYHMPWPIEAVVTPSVTRINRVEVGFRQGGQSDTLGLRMTSRGLVDTGAGPDTTIPAESLMLTGDENIIDIDFAVFWRVRDAGDYLFNTRHPDETVKAIAESLMREVIGHTPIQPALTEARARIETDVMTGMQKVLDNYHAGIEITQVQLQKVDPPTDVIESFRDVQRANTDADRARNEAEAYRNDIVPGARGDAARIVAEADGARQASIAEASGQAQRFLSVYAAYSAAKDVTLRRLYIETMQELVTKTPTIVVDDSVRGLLPLLNLNDAPGTKP